MENKEAKKVGNFVEVNPEDVKTVDEQEQETPEEAPETPKKKSKKKVFAIVGGAVAVGLGIIGGIAAKHRRHNNEDVEDDLEDVEDYPDRNGDQGANAFDRIAEGLERLADKLPGNEESDS